MAAVLPAGSGMLRALAQARGGSGTIAVIDGSDVTEAVAAVLAAAQRHGMRVAAGRAYPTDAGLPYAAVLRAVAAMRPPAPAIQERIHAQLGGADPRDGLSRLPSRTLALFTGVNAILSALDELTTLTPTTLVLQDLHWADEATLATASRLATYVARIPLLVVATWHPDHRSEHTKALERVAVALRAPVVRLDPALTPPG